jgi:phage terminase large subunit-like protein
MWAERLKAAREAGMPEAMAAVREMTTDWGLWAEDAQAPPGGDWRVWMFMGGRGSGKTRAGAEWVRGMVEAGLAKRVALVGPTLSDVREVMIEGPSGLRSLSYAREEERPRYESSRRRLVWDAYGAEAFAFSAEDPDSLRGPQFDAAWCDEAGRGGAGWACGTCCASGCGWGAAHGRR